MEDVQDSAVLATAQTPADAGSYAQGIHPWRRYFARVIDNLVNTFIFGMLLMLVLAFTQPEALNALIGRLETVNRFVDAVMTVFIGTALNVLLFAMLGTTLGKWIFGIRVREADGNRLGFKRTAHREFYVWMRGLAFGIPLISIITLLRAYNQLGDFRQTTWDRDMQLVVTHRPASVWQYLLWTLAIIGWVAFTVFSLIPV